METTITNISPVSFTDRAVREIGRLIREKGTGDTIRLRVGVKGGGCTGLSYVLGFDEKQEKDTEYSSGDFHYIMNPAHGIYLEGMEIDWEDGLNARGFTFKNPNASKTCGCGSSFAV